MKTDKANADNELNHSEAFMQMTGLIVHRIVSDVAVAGTVQVRVNILATKDNI